MQEIQRENIVYFNLGENFSKIEEEFSSRFPAYTARKIRENGVSIRFTSPFTLFPFIQFFEQKGFPVYEAKAVQPSLEEIYIKVTGAELQNNPDRPNINGKQNREGGFVRS